MDFSWFEFEAQETQSRRQKVEQKLDEIWLYDLRIWANRRGQKPCAQLTISPDTWMSLQISPCYASIDSYFIFKL